MCPGAIAQWTRSSRPPMARTVARRPSASPAPSTSLGSADRLPSGMSSGPRGAETRSASAATSISTVRPSIPPFPVSLLSPCLTRLVLCCDSPGHAGLRAVGLAPPARARLGGLPPRAVEGALVPPPGVLPPPHARVRLARGQGRGVCRAPRGRGSGRGRRARALLARRV